MQLRDGLYSEFLNSSCIVLFLAFVAYGLSGYAVSSWMILRERQARAAGSR
jgi:hypothetical protein